MEILLAIAIGLLVLQLVLNLVWKYGQARQTIAIESIRTGQEKLPETLQQALRLARADAQESEKATRQELQQTLLHLQRAMDDKLGEISRQWLETNQNNRFEMSNNLRDFRLEQRGLMEDWMLQQEKAHQAVRDSLRENFGQMAVKQGDLLSSTEKRLDQMRVTVDEKLTETLSKRLGESFETVGKQLIAVQQGLGEMQTMAADVGGLKKVLSNVKLRGGVGEVQLAMLLEQILAPAQYEANIITKPGSRDAVEFAVKLPGRSEDESAVVYLPIDAKFPKDAYEQLIEAYENGLPNDIDLAAKNMENTIKRMARDIRDKYLAPPHTTDFAILFLPFESIYAEVIRRSSLVDQLRDEFKISVAGPTTLVANLNSLQMGFRTLALQKRSSEVWQVLGAVKTEFEKFGGLLEKTSRNLHSASDTVDELLGKRSRAISRSLKNVEMLPAAEVSKFLPILPDTDEPDEGV